MNDLPSGEWSDLLVGAWWPSSQATETAVASASNRNAIATAYEDYGSVLKSVSAGVLVDEEGFTADSARETFSRGEILATNVAEQNLGKAKAYSDASDAIEGLRSELRTVAESGNQAIDQVQKNTKILDKVTPIVNIIALANAESGRMSTMWGAKVAAATEDVLAASGDLRSIEEFARDHGIPLGGSTTSSNTDALTQQVKGKLDALAQSSSTHSPSSALTGTGFLDDKSGYLTVEQQLPSSVVTETATPEAGTYVRNPINELTGSSMATKGGEVFAAPTSGPLSVNPAVGADSSNTVTNAGGMGITANPGNLSPTTGGGGGIGNPGLSSPANLGSSPQPLSPESLAQSFNSGVQAGAPASAGAEALSQGISDTVQSQAPQNAAPPPPPVAPTVASSGFAYEAPQTFSEPPAQSAPAEAHSQPMYAAPVAAAPAAPVAPIAAAPPAAPAGPLPAYGSDLRPAAAAAPPPPAAAPLSAAPVNPASGTAAGNQPAVVRQQPGAATPTTANPTGMVENALTSATTGAAAGAAAEQSMAQARLDRLLEAVARQEPKLKWAIGDREDGSTVLVTDLASGWIPPHIEIPKGVDLLAPEKRRGGLEHLLGETTNHAIWTPGHYLPNAKDVEPVEMTFRARQVPDIGELNWELTQATNWRDGLPRLAHTLAKAGIAGTGVLETEADLLYEHLTTIRDKVVKSYPGAVDLNDVGNWQLLAAISGLIASDKTTLKYHFAWFQALSMATQGGPR